MCASLSDYTVRKSRREISSARALFLKPGARRKDAVAKQSARKRVKFTGAAGKQICRNNEISSKFKQAFDAARKISIKFRRAISLRRVKFHSARA